MAKSPFKLDPNPLSCARKDVDAFDFEVQSIDEPRYHYINGSAPDVQKFKSSVKVAEMLH